MEDRVGKVSDCIKEMRVIRAELQRKMKEFLSSLHAELSASIKLVNQAADQPGEGLTRS